MSGSDPATAGHFTMVSDRAYSENFLSEKILNLNGVGFRANLKG